ncbi:hypothetical protein [Bradyrhizobium sp. BR 1433]|uniref:hypothetical protein n=1 Tax=Bradyrhizobium sp. BR 1433 TaxID=3447967 RepID=UPI003EE593B0
MSAALSILQLAEIAKSPKPAPGVADFPDLSLSVWHARDGNTTVDQARRHHRELEIGSA